MKRTSASPYIRLTCLFACFICVFVAAGCTDAQPEVVVTATDIAITSMDSASETIWYSMTLTATNTGKASASDVVASVTLMTPDSTQMSRMAHESVEFGTIPPGDIRSATVAIKLVAGPVGYDDIINKKMSPVVTTKIDQMGYLSLPF
ncbi:MAG: hypothetical protein WC346_19180 [Methanogenium sp.]|jgi:hypothetical protein